MASLLEALAKTACASARKSKAYTDEKISIVEQKLNSSADIVEGLEGFTMEGKEIGNPIIVDDVAVYPAKLKVTGDIGSNSITVIISGIDNEQEHEETVFLSNGETLTIENTYPIMTISTQTDGALLEFEYTKDPSLAIEKLIQAIISLGGYV